LLRGLVIGFSIAAPVGPIGVLCVRRTLADGRVFGLLSGLGAATADAIYGCIAGFGLTLILDFMVDHLVWLRLVGGAFLLYLGVRTFTSKVAEEPASAKGAGLAGAYASTLFLTLTNPVTILSFVGIFAGLGLAESNAGGAVLTVLGVFLGSALWWLTLSGVVGLFRERLGQGILRWVNRISGVVIAGFGVFALASLIV
jgi:threonine/homoserine/homoserine lactone efflux protein